MFFFFKSGVATLAFTLTWLPFWHDVIENLIGNYQEASRPKSTIHSGPISLIDFILIKTQRNSFYLNYVLNPIFYSFVNRRFRQNVLVLFKKVLEKVCCCCRKINYCKLSKKDGQILAKSQSRLTEPQPSSLLMLNQSRKTIKPSILSGFILNCCSKNSKNPVN